MGTPCIGLYGTTNPVDSGAFGPNHIIVQKWYQSGSTRKRRKADNDAMRDILASDVFSACDQMIKSLGHVKKSVA
jgi:ADP-heptose:LPS heptosyltransferase